MFVLIVPIFIYSKMVDRMRRYQLLCALSLTYGFVGLLFAYLLGHPSIGLLNTSPSSGRLFGWLFYFFIEGYSPFVVSVFWSFANSISNQEAAKKNYGLMVGGSKIGGMLATLFAMIVVNWSSHISRIQDVINHQILLVTASVASLAVPIFIILLMRRVPGRYLHGYEAVYKVEKERQKKGTSKTGAWSGLTMLINEPYVLGMFGILFFYELINTFLSYQRICIASAQSTNASSMSSFLYLTTFIMHILGFTISVFGTRKLIETFGAKICLMIVPVINFIFVIFFMIYYTPFALILASVVTKAVHFAFSFPLKESLYIPTIKEIKFKSKSWIDTFGQKFARATGSAFNYGVRPLAQTLFLTANIAFLTIAATIWFVVAFLVGKRYEKAVSNNEVIGLELTDLHTAPKEEQISS